MEISLVISRAFATLTMLLIFCRAAASEESHDAAKADLEKQTQAKQLLEYLQRIKFERVTGNDFQSIPLIDRPLLKYTDPVRANEQGTVWAWGQEGRPLALVEIFQFGNGGRRMQAMTLTSTELVVATVSNQLTWSPQESSIQFQSLSSDSPPAERESQRLGQLKDLARKFDACEYWDPNNSRYELRLLVQPIHRYQDPEKKVLDGAIFLFAHGTNPEIALLIEAQGETIKSSDWHFAMARLGSAELQVTLDGKEVWRQARGSNDFPKSTDPYWWFFMNPISTKK